MSLFKYLSILYNFVAKGASHYNNLAFATKSDFFCPDPAVIQGFFVDKFDQYFRRYSTLDY